MNNWVIIELGEIANSIKGKKPKKLDSKKFEDSIPYLDIKAFEKDDIRQFAEKRSSRIVNENQVVMVWDGARSGWVGIGRKGALGSTLAIINVPIINQNYLYRYMQSNFRTLNTETKGTGIPHVDPDILWKLDFPIPPLNEQKRIADKLDEAFEYIDSLKRRMEKIPELLKQFRESILNYYLGSKDNIKSWTTLEEINIEIQTGPFGSALHQYDYVTNGINVINPIHIKQGKIHPSDTVSITKEKFKELSRYKLNIGDVLLGRRGKMGRAAVVEDIEMICGTGCLILRRKEGISPKFLSYYLRSPYCVDYLLSNSVGSTMVNLNQKILKSIKYPDIDELTQEKLVITIEVLFDLADKIETKYKRVNNNVEELPQSILNKAFNGELVPQDPNDEPAEILLQRIISEMQKIKPTYKKKR